MVRRVSSPTSAEGSRARKSGSQDDEPSIRTYLRLLVGAPVRGSDRLEPAEAAFVGSAAEWAKRAGVDRKTLAGIGVPRQVLDAADVRGISVADLIRRQYPTSPFTIAEVTRRSGVSPASVRNVVAEDERAGRVQRLATKGRTAHYGLR